MKINANVIRLWMSCLFAFGNRVVMTTWQISCKHPDAFIEDVYNGRSRSFPITSYSCKYALAAGLDYVNYYGYSADICGTWVIIHHTKSKPRRWPLLNLCKQANLFVPRRCNRQPTVNNSSTMMQIKTCQITLKNKSHNSVCKGRFRDFLLQDALCSTD